MTTTQTAEGTAASPWKAAPPANADDWAPRRLIDVCSSALRHLGGPPSIGVTSCLRGEGRTTIAVGMALAEHFVFRRDAILVELDLEMPALALQLGLRNRPGVADIIRDGVRVDQCIQRHESGLAVVVAGDTGDDPGGLIAGLRETDLIAQLGVLGDVVVADLPPLSPVGQGTLVADVFSTVLLVVRAGVTPVPAIRRAVEGLPTPPSVLLNGVESPLPRLLRAMFRG